MKYFGGGRNNIMKERALLEKKLSVDDAREIVDSGIFPLGAPASRLMPHTFCRQVHFAGMAHLPAPAGAEGDSQG
jgi:hypothetical protein